MRQPGIGRDPQLAMRMTVTMLLLGAVYGFFIFVLWKIGVGFLPLVIFAAILMLVQYWMSDKMVLWSMKAKVVTREQEPKLHDIVERLATEMQIPKPRIAISKLEIPNAFATGRNPKKAVVAVTTGLLRRLNDDELEGVLAHELAHVKHRDVTVITLASFFAMVASMIVNSFMWIFLFGGTGRRNRNGMGQLMVVYFVAMLVWIVAQLLIMALSRYRELAADRGGAIATGQPNHLASALMKISTAMDTTPKEELQKVEKANAFFIIPAAHGFSVAELLATHPPIKQRIERLQRLQDEMEGRIYPR